MGQPIRVLHVLQRMEAAGVQTLLMSIYRNIDRDKVQFDFLTHYTQEQFFDAEIEAMGGKVHRLSVREDYDLLKYWRDLNAFFKQHKEYRVVHGHMPVLGYFYLSAAKRHRVPVRIAHAHTNQHFNDLKGLVARFMKTLYSLKANRYFACSESAGKYFFGNRDYRVIRNVIMTERFVYNEQVRRTKRAELGLSENLVIGHAARFAEHKNHAFLIDVFAEIVKLRPDAVLILAGDGELRPAIEKKVEQLGLKNSVRFLGVRSDINELYQAMDAFVFPSIFEGLGIVNIEAQASGVMTFCSDAVPQEANISPVYTAIELEKGAAEWAKIIVGRTENREPRRDMTEYVVKAGYDAKTLAKELEEYYLKAHGSR